MPIAEVRVHCLGTFSAWAKQLLEGMHESELLSLVWEPSANKFLEHVVPHEGIPIAMVENSPEGKKLLQLVRQSGKRVFLIWMGKAFSKEDLHYAIDARVYCVLDNPEMTDARIPVRLKRVAAQVELLEHFDHLFQSLKSVLVQSDGALDAANFGEVKTVVSKLERCSIQNEFAGDQTESSGGDVKLPFNRSQGLSDALLTVHDLERTGTLWVRGNVAQQEGKVEFLQGKVISANTGEVRGLKAIYRMFLWDESRFLFNRRAPEDLVLEEQLNMSMKSLCGDGENFKARFDAIRRELPPPELRVELEPNAMHTGSRLAEDEFQTLASVVELNRVGLVIDYNPLPDVILYESLIHLRKSKMIRVAMG